jgi:hypothetical protein
MQAYGPDGLGILTVSGVPGYTKLRSSLLTCIDKLAKLPPNVLAKYEDRQSLYNIGWVSLLLLGNSLDTLYYRISTFPLLWCLRPQSHGKEQLRDGTADTFKVRPCVKLAAPLEAPKHNRPGPAPGTGNL